MKTTKSHLALTLLAGSCVCLTLSEPTRALTPIAPDTIWQADPQTPGSWHDGSNWTAGVPTITDRAALTNNGTINIRGGARADDLELSSGFGGTVNHLRGRSKFNSLRVRLGDFNLRGGRVEADNVSLQNPFPLPVPFFAPAEPNPFTNFPAEDSVNIVEQPLSLEGIIQTWVLPVKKIEQSGGRLNINDRLAIHDGTFHMKQGRLRSDSLLIDARTPLRLTWGIPSPELPLPTGFLQQGGRVNIAGKALIQDGSYTLERGRFQTGNLALGDPAMESDTLRFWQSQRTPSFLQTGGRSHIRGNLEMCAPVIFDPIQLAPFRNVSYDLQGGRLRVDNDVIVGSMGVAPVSFTQSGGRANFGGTLRIEGDSSRYEISDGRLTANVLEVGMERFNTGGVFSMHESAKVTIRERVSLGAESVFQATPNSRLRLLGGTFENFSQDEQALAGLNNLQLFFDGNDQFDLSGERLASYLEVAGQDLADVEEGFDENFALAGLHVGGRFGTTLQLVDQVDNQLDDDGVEALYVDRLYVEAGSTLDLAGIPLYYRSAIILGEVIGSAAQMIQVVPEPTSWVLTFLGLAMATMRQRSPKK